MTLSRYEHTGNAPATGLSVGIGSTDTSFTVLSGTNYPTGATGDFVICLDGGTSSEEKVLCSARSGAAFTVASGGRGYDGTTAASHSAGTTNVTHVLSAAEIDDTSAHIYTTTRDDHTQYARTDGSRAVTGAQTFSNGLTVTAGGATVTAGGLTVSAGGAQVSGNSKVTGTLETTGALTVDAGGAQVSGNSTVTGTLTVTSLTQTADDASWNAPSLTNGSNFGAPYLASGYRKVNGRVYLRGCVNGLTVGQAIFTLPAGYRPSGSAVFPVSSNSSFGYVTIASTGVVTLGGGTNGFVFLDGICFDTL